MQIPKKILVGSRREYSISHLFMGAAMGTAREANNERQLLKFTLPHWQRKEVWTQPQKKAFVEGIFLGFGTGQYVVNGADWMNNDSGEALHLPYSGWLIDGQQRICALRDFVQGGLSLFDGLTYEGMAAPDKLRFMREPFPCFEMDYTDDEAVLKTLYNRMNFGGTAHNPEDFAN